MLSDNLEFIVINSFHCQCQDTCLKLNTEVLSKVKVINKLISVLAILSNPKIFV